MSITVSGKSNLNVKVDTEMKDEATALLKQMGLTMSAAVNMFIAQLVNDRGLPFTPRTSFEAEVIEAAKHPTGKPMETDADIDAFMASL